MRAGEGWAKEQAKPATSDTQAVGERIDGGKSDAGDEFLEDMKGSPEERLRDRLLKALDVTEEDLEAMPLDERLAIEEKSARSSWKRLSLGRLSGALR